MNFVARSLFLAASLLAMPAIARAETYVRVGAAYEHSGETGFRDLDCAAPRAVYGCGAATSGQPLSTRGGFGGTPAVQFGLGRRASPWFRFEAELGWRPGLDFKGAANFNGAPRATADASGLTAMGIVYADLGSYGRLRPFLGAGIGASRNRIGAVRFEPAGASALPAGKRTALVWTATAGVAAELSARLTLDVAYRYLDLGDMRTGAGAVAPTTASLSAQGMGVSLRRRF